MRKILIISGKQGSGKTSITDGIVKMLGSVANIQTFKFAGPLYEMHDAMLPILKKYKIRPEDMTKDGELLQTLGTEYGRNKISENVWVNISHRFSTEFVALADTNLAIIDDCRFENEFNGFIDSAFKVRLECPEEVRKARCSYWRENTTHPSETGLDDYAEAGKFDLYLNTEFYDLEQCIKRVINEWHKQLPELE